MDESRQAMLANVDQTTSVPGGDGRVRFCPSLECMTPEAAAVYAGDEAVKAKIAKLIDGVDKSLPFWWMNGMNLGGAGGEGSFQPPQFATQVFLTKAWVLKEPYAKLAEQLPWPNVYTTMPSYRDLNYLQDLAACIAAAEQKGGAQ